MGDIPSPGTAADIKRWAENRRTANAVEVRELRTAWGTPEKAFSAFVQMLGLYARVNGWPPPDDPIDRRDQEAVWRRFDKLRSRLSP